MDNAHSTIREIMENHKFSYEDVRDVYFATGDSDLSVEILNVSCKGGIPYWDIIKAINGGNREYFENN